MEMTCSYCGKILPPNTSKQRRYCSDACRAKAYYYRHQEARKTYCRERYHKKYKQRAFQIVKCTRCGTEFIQSRISQKYCSKACYNAVYKLQHRKKIISQIQDTKVATPVVKPVEVPQPKETRPWVLENRQPNQKEINALLDKIFDTLGG